MTPIARRKRQKFVYSVSKISCHHYYVITYF